MLEARFTFVFGADFFLRGLFFARDVFRRGVAHAAEGVAMVKVQGCFAGVVMGVFAVGGFEIRPGGDVGFVPVAGVVFGVVGCANADTVDVVVFFGDSETGDADEHVLVALGGIGHGEKNMSMVQSFPAAFFFGEWGLLFIRVGEMGGGHEITSLLYKVCRSGFRGVGRRKISYLAGKFFPV